MIIIKKLITQIFDPDQQGIKNPNRNLLPNTFLLFFFSLFEKKEKLWKKKSKG